MSMMMKYLRYVMALLLMVLAVETDAVERKKYNFNSDWLLYIGDA